MHHITCNSEVEFTAINIPYFYDNDYLHDMSYVIELALAGARESLSQGENNIDIR